ncbi:hypothetical protein Tco_0451851 [Tanacetum coccineum]
MASTRCLYTRDAIHPVVDIPTQERKSVRRTPNGCGLLDYVVARDGVLTKMRKTWFGSMPGWLECQRLVCNGWWTHSSVEALQSRSSYKIFTGFRTFNTNADCVILKERESAMADMKFTYVVSYQLYGAQKKSSAGYPHSCYANILDLMLTFGSPKSAQVLVQILTWNHFEADQARTN